MAARQQAPPPMDPNMMAALMQMAGGPPSPGMGGPPMGPTPPGPGMGPMPPGPGMGPGAMPGMPPGPVQLPPNLPPGPMPGAMPPGPAGPDITGDLPKDLVNKAVELLQIAVGFFDPASADASVLQGILRDLTQFSVGQTGTGQPLGPGRAGGVGGLVGGESPPIQPKGLRNLPDVPPPPPGGMSSSMQML